MPPYRSNDYSNVSLAPEFSNERRRYALSELLAAFRTDWMHDHLMGVLGTTDAGILSSPLQQSYSIPFESDLRFGPHDPSKMDCSMLSSSEQVIVPAFSKDGMSAGYLIAETYGLYSDELLMRHNGPYLLRFISNEYNGNYVGVVRVSSADVVICYTHSNRGSSFHWFFFPKDTMLSLSSNRITDVTGLENAIHTVLHADIARQCFNCGTTVTCSCSIGLIPAKSPLDLAAIKRNLAQIRLGQIYRNGVVEFFDKGVSKSITPVHSRYQIVRDAKQGTANRLLNWAIGNVLGNTSIGMTLNLSLPFEISNPLNFASGDVPDGTVHRSSDFENVNTSSSIIPPADHTTPPVAPVASPLTTCFDGSVNVTDLSTNASTCPVTTQAIDFSRPCNQTFIPVPAGVENSIGDTGENGEELSLSELRSLPLIEPAIPQISTTTPNQEAVAQTQFPWDGTTGPITTPIIYSGRPANFSFAPVTPVGDNIHSQRHTLPTSRMQPVEPVAPEIFTAMHPNPEASVQITPHGAKNDVRSMRDNGVVLNEEKMKKTEEELRVETLYQRKIRNRESAARSNRARKQRREIERRKEQATRQ